MSDELIVIEIFPSVEAADSARGQLEASGVPAFVRASRGMGVRLAVHEHDAHRAAALLAVARRPGDATAVDVPLPPVTHRGQPGAVSPQGPVMEIGEGDDALERDPSSPRPNDRAIAVLVFAVIALAMGVAILLLRAQ